MSSSIKFATVASILAAAGAVLFIVAPGGLTPDDGVVAPPGAEPPSASPSEGEGTLTYGENFLCDFGRSWPTQLPACETSEDDNMFTFGFSNPQVRSSAFEGISVLNGTLVANLSVSTFDVGGSAFFAGDVEDCGSGTIVFDWSGGGTIDENDVLTWEANDYTSVPGGLTLPITATISDGSEGGEVRNSDGSKTIAYSATYTCELPTAE